MAALSWLARRQLPQVVSQLSRALRLVRPPRYLGGPPVRRLHGSARSRLGEQGPWGKSRAPEHQYQLTELDRADAMMLRKSHETGFLAWFRNGLVATGIGVIAFVQSEVGREAGYAFFTLGGVCVSFGAASYVVSLVVLRRTMLLSLPAMLLHVAVVTAVELFWLCAVSLYIGRLEVEIIHDDDDDDPHDPDECPDCRERRQRRGYGSHGDGHRGDEDDRGKGPQDK